MDTIDTALTSPQERACAAASKAKGFACEAVKQGRIALDETLLAAKDCTTRAAGQKPMQTLGIAAGVGLVLGFLLSRG
jgi:ElaB/YqjD/DUF883 family membrane-anchored ribosome-binding protein